MDALAFAFVNERANRERFLRDLEELQRRAREDCSSDFGCLAVPVVSGEPRPPNPSRSTIWRILEEVDLKPHRSVYWLNSHDPDFDAKGQDICGLYLDAPRFHEQGRLVLSSDEKTGMQALGRPHPTQEAQPGKPAKVEFDYIRQGTRCLLTTFCVPTGKVVWDLLPTRTSADWAAHLRHVVQQFPSMKRYDWVVDNLNTHWSLEVCRLVAELSDLKIDERQLRTGAQRREFLTDASHKVVFHFTPIHGSWLNQVELFFGVLTRRFLRRAVFGSMAEFEGRLDAWLKRYDSKHAHPYQWTYAALHFFSRLHINSVVSYLSCRHESHLIYLLSAFWRGRWPTLGSSRRGRSVPLPWLASAVRSVHPLLSSAAFVPANRSCNCTS